jgi:hypothetical protein
MEYICIIGIWFLCGIVAASLYRNKGGSEITGFLIGLVLGPIGILIALVSGDQRPRCPFCKEHVSKGATICPHCRKELQVPDDQEPDAGTKAARWISGR